MTPSSFKNKDLELRHKEGNRTSGIGCIMVIGGCVFSCISCGAFSFTNLWWLAAIATVISLGITLWGVIKFQMGSWEADESEKLDRYIKPL